ncbi:MULTISPECIES: 50S ribosomal protein L15 [unclassified Bartonella]|uniref:50S ribosomal protein L15 n=1 Tax=unclassified Bartonella TaxID=2645622 RepID=UPI00099A6A53|nr:MULTISPECIES: 50S ribosomal protein L15 [unclassified Bartonella]AQX18199.1 LSU ribosomal protein L15P [Bartonella sp. A1379B]AQX22714.1 large subunit ribosomal protein L15 [Bartonella sp. 11B]AQX24001.1 large subunit ribosomal protein L15 [Bartonella sp. 114]AQX25163.1 LSU ribosomal protein L15P [Bartonella sp. Coyote22sub2]
MKLNELRDREGATKSYKRIGRGIGSGTGKTGGCGVKGQKSRSGVSLNGFEGGQMPIYRRLPKRGFKNLFSKAYNEVSLGRIQLAVDAGKLDIEKSVDVVTLKEAGIISRVKDGVRLLSDGELKVKMTFNVSGASEMARKKIEKAGGQVNFCKVTQ